jgi:hypothetical protein
MLFWIVTRCGLADFNVSEKHRDLKMETVYSSETLVSTYKSIRRCTEMTNIDKLRMFENRMLRRKYGP